MCSYDDSDDNSEDDGDDDDDDGHCGDDEDIDDDVDDYMFWSYSYVSIHHPTYITFVTIYWIIGLRQERWLSDSPVGIWC